MLNNLGSFTRGKSYSDSCFGFYLQVFRHLLNQAMYKSSSESTLLVAWSFMAMIITCCFSGIFVSLLVIPVETKIDTIDELVASNLKIYNINESWIWHRLGVYAKYKNVQVDPDIAKIKSRIQFLDENDQVSLR